MLKKYWNGQKYCECHLIALWNAAIYYNLKVPERYGNEYEKDCYSTACISGACINDNKIKKKLGLHAIKGILTWDWIKDNCPIEFKLFCHRGYHSTLAIDVNYKKQKVLLTNYAVDKLYWLSINKILMKHNKFVNPIKWVIDK